MKILYSIDKLRSSCFQWSIALCKSPVQVKKLVSPKKIITHFFAFNNDDLVLDNTKSAKRKRGNFVFCGLTRFWTFVCWQNTEVRWSYLCHTLIPLASGYALMLAARQQTYFGMRIFASSISH